MSAVVYNIAILFNIKISFFRRKINAQYYVMFVSVETVKTVTSMTFYLIQVDTSLQGTGQGLRNSYQRL